MRAKSFLLCLTIFLATLSFTAPQVPAAAEAPVKKPKAPAGVRKPPAQPAAPAKTGTDAQGKAVPASTDPSPGHIEARSAILMEVSTGTILFEQNADETIEPASFTKIASLYLVFEALKLGRINLSDEVWISEGAWRTGGSKMFVGVGTKVPLDEILKGIAVVSGNDACVAAAEHLSGSVDTFVEAMNNKSRELGMTKSYFLNPHGLPMEGQITTARDMALLDATYLKKFPESLRFHSMREYTYNNITQYNRNHLLLKDQSVDGLKTGFVGAAGYHLAATAQREGMRLLAVVMGAATPAIREREAMKLLNYGFRYYALVSPFPPDQPLATPRVWKGQTDQVGLYAQEAPSYLISQAQKKALRWEINAPADVTAPVQNGQVLGDLVFYVSDQPKRSVSLISREDIAPGGLFKRAWHSVVRIQTIDWRWPAGILGVVALTVLVFFLVAGRRSSTAARSRSLGK